MKNQTERKRDSVDRQERRRQRNGTIDFFKFVFALVIAIFHISPLFNIEGRQLFGSGRIAVEFFFMVSGYLLVEKSRYASMQNGIFHENVRMLKGKVIHVFPYILPAAICGCVFYSFQYTSPNTLTDKLLFSLSDIYGLQMLGFPIFPATGVSWYLSVLFFVSFLIYPVLCKKRELFTKYIGPITAIAILGYISRNSGTLTEPGAWWGWTFKGMLRGYADMALGCMAYEIAAYYRDKENVNRTLLSIFEMAGYAVILGYAVFHRESNRYDFLIIPLILMTVSISFSKKSIWPLIFDHPAVHWLGIFSISVFLNHEYIVELFLRGAFPEAILRIRCLIYAGLVVGISLLNYFLGKLLAKKINTGERMLCVTLLYICIAVALHFVVR